MAKQEPMQVKRADFAGFISKVEMAAKPTKFGRVHLEMQTDPLFDTIRYYIISSEKFNISRPIKKFAFAIECYNNIEDLVNVEAEFEKLDSAIVFSNQFA